MLIICVVINYSQLCRSQVSHQSATDIINNTGYGKDKAHATLQSLWETLYDKGVIDTGMHKSKYHWGSIKIKFKGGNIETTYMMKFSMKGNQAQNAGEPPPSSHPPKTKGGRRNITYKKLREKTVPQEYARTSWYTSEFRRDVSNNPSSNRGSQRRRWKS